jgi:thioredoxin-related protein
MGTSWLQFQDLPLRLIVVKGIHYMQQNTPLHCFFTLTVVVTLILLFNTPAQAAGSVTVAWQGYDQAKKLAASSGKPILLHFYTDWCTYCKKMDQETFANRRVAAYMNENFVVTKVNSAKQSGLAEKYHVRSVPSNWFLKPDGTSINNLPGFIKPELFLWVLKYMSTNSYMFSSFEDYMKHNKVEDLLSNTK